MLQSPLEFFIKMAAEQCAHAGVKNRLQLRNEGTPARVRRVRLRRAQRGRQEKLRYGLGGGGGGVEGGGGGGETSTS